MNDKSLSEIITKWVFDFKLEDVDKKTIDCVKMHILDALGCAIAAYDEPHSKMMKKIAKIMHSNNEALLWGTNEKVALVDAVIHNAGLIHGLDFDDTHAGAITHPSASIVAAGLTIGDAMNATGKEVLEAIIIGYEIILRLGIAAHGKFHDIGFHPTGIIAPFASACIGARLMKYDSTTLINALGLCGSQAGAIQEYLHDGTWNKKLHPGWGIHSAIYSLKLAKEGFLGTREVFEGSYGFYKTHIGEYNDLFDIFSDLGKIWRINEVAFKFYPTCHWTHTDMDLLLEIMNEEHMTYKDIEKIECFIDPRGAGSVVLPEKNKRYPETEYQLRFSLYWAMAIAAVRRKVSLEEINYDITKDLTIKGMMERVNIIIDENEEVKGHFPGKIKVYLYNGKIIEKTQKYEKGCLENPANMQDIRYKIINNIKRIEKNRIDELFYSVNNIEIIENINTILQCII